MFQVKRQAGERQGQRDDMRRQRRRHAVCQAGEGERGLRERDETDNVVAGEQRSVGVCLRAHESTRKKNVFDTRD